MLTNREGPILILDFHNYVSPIAPDTILVWHQHHVASGPTAPVVLRAFYLPGLRALGEDVQALCESMRRARLSFIAGTAPVCESSVPTTVASEPLELVFPEQLHQIEELLVLCHSSGVEDSPTWDRSNLALLVARPRDGMYQLFPQDWFNSANLDFGYQWVARVARDPRTGMVHGDGVRISPFVLDETLRNLL